MAGRLASPIEGELFILGKMKRTLLGAFDLSSLDGRGLRGG
jgi:hypothetical protein